MNKFARMMKRKILIAFSFLFFGFSLCAQNLEKMYRYDFDGALAEYRDSLAACPDSLRRAPFEMAARWAENGISMTEYCHQPAVVARRRFHKDDFFLYYPLEDGAWHRTQDGSKVIYDISGAVDTLVLNVRDSLDLFPVVCGSDRYFASRDLYGMGGYDLYVSHWDAAKADWGVPENLGFPYSSPFNDYLFINTDDGKYSIFASDRDCPPDSVNVYVLEYDPNPVCGAISDPVKLREIAALEPPRKEDRERLPVAEPDEPTRKYIEKLNEVRSYRNLLSKASAELDALRSVYSTADGKEKAELSEALMEGELKMTSLRGSLDRASGELREMEMDFLTNGVEVNIDAFLDYGRDSGDSGGNGYEFRKRTMGKPVVARFLCTSQENNE